MCAVAIIRKITHLAVIVTCLGVLPIPGPAIAQPAPNRSLLPPSNETATPRVTASGADNTANSPVSQPPAVVTAPDRPQVAAATVAAVENLRTDILREPLHGRMTVGDFLRRAKANDILARELGRLDRVGGPRWLDTETCQVQLEISGTRLSRLLTEIAASNHTAPLSPEEVARFSSDWRRRTFIGSGSSTNLQHVLEARPRTATATWASVAEADRRAALLMARDDALARVISSIRRVSLGRYTLADALAVTDIRRDVDAWLDQLPVTRVNYRRDVQVELTLAATPDVLFDILRHSIEQHGEKLDAPTTDSGWDRVRQEFFERMEPAIGRGTVSAGATAPTPVPPQVGGSRDVPPEASMRNSNELRPPTAMTADAPPRPSVAVLVTPPTTDPGSTKFLQPVPPRGPIDTGSIPSNIPRWAADQVSVAGHATAGSSKLKAARQAETMARSKLANAIEILPLTRSMSIGQAANRDARIREAVLRAVDKATVEKTDYYRGPDVQVELKLELREVWDQLNALR